MCHTFAGSLRKDEEEGNFSSLPACSNLVSTFIPLLALEPTSLSFQQDQLSHTALWIEYLLDSWTFSSQLATVGLAGL